MKEIVVTKGTLTGKTGRILNIKNSGLFEVEVDTPDDQHFLGRFFKLSPPEKIYITLAASEFTYAVAGGI